MTDPGQTWPGGLKPDPATGNGELTTDADAMGMIMRADLAALILDCLDDETATTPRDYA